MSATAKFYTGFGLALALVIIVSAYAGYCIGVAHGKTIHVTHAGVTKR